MMSAVCLSKKRGPYSAEHRANISAALRGKKYGPPSAETNAKRSASLKRFWASEEGKLARGVLVKRTKEEGAARRAVAGIPEGMDRRYTGYYFRSKYGITVDDYDKMLRRQNGLCAICGKLPSGKHGDKRLCVDHDHASGKVRGLLCLSCNTKLGWLENQATEIRLYLVARLA